ncbi:MAG: M14 family metallocarboxypeptidase [Oscillospiraceae bacterium]|nr:M14 family metallocarboxypeptidase [Oscillospiraceae bacterium]
MDFYRLPTAENCEKYMREIHRKHPCSKSFFIGKSVLNRKISVLSLGKPVGSTLFVAGTHGSEWLCSLVLFRFFDEVCSAFEHGENLCGINIGKAVANRGLTVVPVLNPDGTEINLLGSSAAFSSAKRISRLAKGDFEHWNANARGVDINHNFGAGWNVLHEQERKSGIFGPAPRQYGGPKAFSEPETRAICGFCSTFDVQRLWSFHSQGEEVFWYYGTKTPIISRDIAEEFAFACGYKTAFPKGMASHGGLKDWYIENFRRPGFTVEIGLGENPLPLSDFDSVYEKLKPALAKALFM